MGVRTKKGIEVRKLKCGLYSVSIRWEVGSACRREHVGTVERCQLPEVRKDARRELALRRKEAAVQRHARVF